MREGRHSHRATSARVLREAHAGAQAQEGRCHQAAHEACVPRRHAQLPLGIPQSAMALKERITEDMKTAMRAGEKERLATVRLLLAAIKQREVDERIALDDGQVLAVLEKMIKQRREAITQFESGGRADLVAKETAEIAVLRPYLPAQM